MLSIASIQSTAFAGPAPLAAPRVSPMMSEYAKSLPGTGAPTASNAHSETLLRAQLFYSGPVRGCGAFTHGFPSARRPHARDLS